MGRCCRCDEYIERIQDLEDQVNDSFRAENALRNDLGDAEDKILELQNQIIELTLANPNRAALQKISEELGQGVEVEEPSIFRQVLDEMWALHQAKNKDYGNAGDMSYILFENSAVLIRLWDKLLRLTQLELSGKSEVKSESFDDTLIDLANYAAMALAARRKYSGVSPQEAVTVALEGLLKNIGGNKSGS